MGNCKNNRSVTILFDEVANTGYEPPAAYLADLEPVTTQDAADAGFNIAQLGLQQLAAAQQRPRGLGICLGRVNT